MPKMSQIAAELKPDFSRVIGHTLSALSANASHYQRLHDRIMAADSPAYTPLIWRLAWNRASTIKDWAVFPGNPKAGPLPSRWPTAGIIEIDASLIDRHQAQHNGGEHAVAYRLGSAVMFGVLPDGFGQPDAATYQVAERIGPGDLHATAGLWFENMQRLVVPAGAIRAGRIALVSEMPADLPMS